MTVTLSTYTDPNGTPRTDILIDGLAHRTFRGSVTDYVKQELGHVWNGARSGTLRRWDGDAKLLHTVAEK